MTIIYITIGVIFASIIVLALVFSRMYKRASSELAFVRTGMGGQKVVTSGGALVLPVVHELIQVRLNTQRLVVERKNEDSLITLDRLRVDVTCEFYLRVANNMNAIATAAQTLGNRTNDVKALGQLIEGKFIDALRAAAAAMTMEQLHENRSTFVQEVKNAVSSDLEKNGLELESVSLTSLNQTTQDLFRADNLFDASGLLKLAEEIQRRNQLRNAIEQDTATAIQKKNLAATQEQLELKRQREEITLETEKNIANMTAEQQATVAVTQAEARRRSEEATLHADQQIAQKRILTSQQISTGEAEAQKVVETARIGTATAVRIAAQEQNILVASKSSEEARAQAEADAARAQAIVAAEGVTTARDVEIARREKAVAMVKAEEDAGREALAITLAANAEREAAGHRAEALRQTAAAERDAVFMRAEGTEKEGAAIAEALRLRNEAQNLLSDSLVNQQVKLATLSALPDMIERSVAPLQKIGSITIEI
ncbi:hypothetical protein LC612_39590, partial [Nostoc sp. CHAB 5834]|nr:hypothetical protein [Nostoc sp. CHAB 5834]